VSASKAIPTRRKTRHPGIEYRERADGSRAYTVYAVGKRHPVDGGEREALELQRQLRGRLYRGERVGSANVTFAAVAEEWYELKARTLRPRSLRNYRVALDKWLLPRFGHWKLGRIRPDDVAALVRDMERNGRSGSTVGNTLKPLGGVFKLALRKGMASFNPLDVLLPEERPSSNERPMRTLTRPEIDALLTASVALAQRPEAQYDYAPLLTTAIYTGLRQGELLGLRWANVNLMEAYIDVREQWTQDGRRTPPKTKAGIRRVYVAPELAQYLREHKARSRFSTEDDPAFASRTGKPLTHSNVNGRGLKPALRAAGLDVALRFQELRHTFASLMIFAGVSAEELAPLMGHEDSGVTRRRYVHLFDEFESAENVRNAASTVFRSGQSLASRPREAAGTSMPSGDGNAAQIATFGK
jgi:integrase